ncbi:MAG: hypothetical protein K0S32_1207 [Bacteroidetes bacterium]|nr:hypothetical protein [Bacteroidota bacterium]
MQGLNLKYSNTKKKPAKTTAFFVCLLLAGMLWGIKILNTVYDHQRFRIPVMFRNIPQNKKPTQALPDHLTIDVKASGLKLLLIYMKQPFKTLEVDFNDLKSVNKQQNYLLSPATIRFKNSLKFEADIVQVSPDVLYFTEKSGYQKNVPVKVPLYVKCVQGYGYRTPELTPAFATIVGDSNAIKAVDTIYTQALSLNNLSQNTEKKMAVIRPNENVYCNVHEVDVKIEVDKLIEHIVYIPVEVGTNDLNVKSINVFPSRVKVKFTALQNNFNPADTASFNATANSSAISKSGRTPVFISTQPGNINVLSIEPKEVELLIIKK